MDLNELINNSYTDHSKSSDTKSKNVEGSKNEVLNEKEIILRLNYPYILEPKEIIGK